jgi:hypothetical protein
MRNAIVCGFVLLCVTLLSILSVSPVDRRISNPDGTAPLASASRPAQVEVTNFPAVQEVSGTVSVSNLTIDAQGRLLVAVQQPSQGALVLHSTTMTYQGDLGGRTGATQKCRTEFPNSHFAGAQEVFNAAGQGTTFQPPGIVWFTSETSSSWVDQFGGGSSCGNWQRVIEPNTGLIDAGMVFTAKGGQMVQNSCEHFRPLLCAE